MYWSLSKLMTPSRSRMTSFTSGGELGDVGHLVHHGAEVREQAQARGPQLRVLDVHQHLVEERVHVGAQARERGERAGEVALRELRLRERGHAGERLLQLLLLGLPQQ